MPTSGSNAVAGKVVGHEKLHRPAWFPEWAGIILCRAFGLGEVYLTYIAGWKKWLFSRYQPPGKVRFVVFRNQRVEIDGSKGFARTFRGGPISCLKRPRPFFTFVFSAVLINENSQIIQIGNALTGIYGCSAGSNKDASDFCTIAVPIAKALLAVSVFMLLSALAYIGVYIYTLIRVLQRNRADTHPSTARRNSGSDSPRGQPNSTRQMDSERYGAPNQYHLYPIQKEREQPRDVGYRQAEPHYPIQQEPQRAPKVWYNQGGVSSNDFSQKI